MMICLELLNTVLYETVSTLCVSLPGTCRLNQSVITDKTHLDMGVCLFHYKLHTDTLPSSSLMCPPPSRSAHLCFCRKFQSCVVWVLQSAHNTGFAANHQRVVSPPQTLFHYQYHKKRTHLSQKCFKETSHSVKDSFASRHKAAEPRGEMSTPATFWFPRASIALFLIWKRLI